MRNLLDEKPAADLHGRLRFSVDYVDTADIAGQRLLDIGCGFGWFELNALSRGALKIVGTELSEMSLRPIRKYLKDPPLTTAVASAIGLPFQDHSFDTVVCWEVLEHIPRRTEAIMFAEVARVLKPGGRFYLSTPSAAPISTLADPAWWLIGHRHYSPGKLRQLATAVGLTVLTDVAKGGPWEILFTWNLYFSNWVLRRRPVAEKNFQARVDREYAAQGFNDLFIKMTKAASASAQ
jgi:2-polyprenyl-3-methyl-5-hydroxy-6-metoxy-1,4-benzoquinol methylase